MSFHLAAAADESSVRAPTLPALMLAEHLDAILAAGEDLAGLRHDVPKPTGIVDAEMLARIVEAEDLFIAEIKALEATLISRVLQSRVRAAELARADARFRPIVSLFIGGTRSLIDAVDALAPRARAHASFAGQHDTMSYLRSRAILAHDAPCLTLVDTIVVPEGFLVAERIRLGDLLDLASTFLNALELHYDLFEAADAAAEQRAARALAAVAEPSGSAAEPA